MRGADCTSPYVGFYISADIPIVSQYFDVEIIPTGFLALGVFFPERLLAAGLGVGPIRPDARPSM